MAYAEVNIKPLATNFTYLLSTHGQYQRLPDMKVRRAVPGTTKYDSSVYVYGGIDRIDPLKCRHSSGERFSLVEKGWSDLPAMKFGRSDFCPCVWRREIYLCGGGSAAMEVLNPAKSTLREAPVSVPVTDILVAFARGEELVALSASCVSVFRYEDCELRATTEEKKILLGIWLQSPVTWEGTVYIPQWQYFLAVDLARLDVTKRYSHPMKPR